MPFSVLARFLRPRGLEIVARDPGVRVEVEVGLVLRRQRDQEPREQRVLEDVGEVAGVKEMAVGEHRVGLEGDSRGRREA